MFDQQYDQSVSILMLILFPTLQQPEWNQGLLKPDQQKDPVLNEEKHELVGLLGGLRRKSPPVLKMNFIVYHQTNNETM